jgi:AbiV family abortive infection protein
MREETISAMELVAGMIACRENARELIDEADILSSAGRHARAYALLHTACEELGKFSVLEIAAKGIFRDVPPKWKRLWQRFRSHDSKSAQLEVQLLWLSLSENGAEDFSELAGALLGSGLTIRNSALYVDRGPTGHFRKPSSIDFSLPFPALHALAIHALAATRRRGESASEIEAELRRPVDDDTRQAARELFVKALEMARDAGIEKEKIEELIKRGFGKAERAPSGR